MKIIISPAKKMVFSNDFLLPETNPPFVNKSEVLRKNLKKLSYCRLKEVLLCNDKIAELNYKRYQSMDLYSNLSPALLSYEGIQFQYMAPNVFEDKQWEYVKEHLFILSGFYGVLRPLDGIVPYRLEMKAKISVSGYKSLYDFWGKSIYQKVSEDTNIILNLASREYSRCIEKYLTPDIKYVTCIFGSFQDGKVRSKTTEAKMARGEMVRFMSLNQIEDLDRIKKFKGLGFRYRNDLSTDTTFVFIKEEVLNC